MLYGQTIMFEPALSVVTALGLGLALALVFVILVLACLGSTVLVLVLVGFRQATRETALALLGAVVGGGIASVTDSSGVVVLGLLLGALAGFGGGRYFIRDQPSPALVQGKMYDGILVVASLAGIGSALLFWFVLVLVAGTDLLVSMVQNPVGGAVVLVVTGIPILISGYVLWHVHQGIQRTTSLASD